MSEVADNPWDKKKRADREHDEKEEVTKTANLGDEVEVKEQIEGEVIRGTATPDLTK